jgi:hypothetical protein
MLKTKPLTCRIQKEKWAYSSNSHSFSAQPFLFPCHFSLYWCIQILEIPVIVVQIVCKYVERAAKTDLGVLAGGLEKESKQMSLLALTIQSLKYIWENPN